MLQTIVASFIVAVAVSWLVWTLFVPATFRARMMRRNTAPESSSCADGCATCAGCPPSGSVTQENVIVWYKTARRK